MPLYTIAAGHNGFCAAVIVAAETPPNWLTALLAVAPVLNTFLLYMMHRRGQRMESKINSTKQVAERGADDLRTFANGGDIPPPHKRNDDTP